MKISPMPELLSAYAKGVMGENAAAHFLAAKGMKELQRRYRCAAGEIDLILLDGEVLIFVEVKARERLDRLQTQYAITPAKQRRMIKSVRWYLGEHPEHAERMIRFDVITVARNGILHLPNAFEGSAW